MQANTVIRNFLGTAGYDLNHPSSNEELLNYYHTYMTDPKNRERIRASAKSNWVRNAIDTKIKRSWRNIVSAAANITHRDLEDIYHQDHPSWVDPHKGYREPKKRNVKSMKQSIIDQLNAQPVKKGYDNGQWDEMAQKSHRQYADLVDHTFHTVNGTMPKGLKAMIESPEPHLGISERGESPKIVTDISRFEDKNDPASHTPSGLVMVKPYHKTMDADQRAPISGWASMATKALFNAGKIGHLAEDVTAAEHNGVPLTVHSFADKYHEPVVKLPYEQDKLYEFSPLHLQQIAAMDFLANNVDRHGFNMLFNTRKPQSQPLAIDHERNFQYQYPVKSYTHDAHNTDESPADYAGRAISAILSYGKQTGLSDKETLGSHDYTDFHNWWREHSKPIRDEMERQLTAIKDDRIRQHIRRNFNARADMIDQWAADGGAHEHMSLFSPDNQARVKLHQLPPKYEGKIEDIISRLPVNDKYLGAKYLADLALHRPKDSDLINEVFAQHVNSMSPEELGSFFANFHDHPALGVLPITYDFIKRNPRRAEYVQAMIDKLNNVRQDGTRLFPFLEHLRDRNAYEGPTAPILEEGNDVA